MDAVNWESPHPSSTWEECGLGGCACSPHDVASNPSADSLVFALKHPFLSIWSKFVAMWPRPCSKCLDLEATHLKGLCGVPGKFLQHHVQCAWLESCVLIVILAPPRTGLYLHQCAVTLRHVQHDPCLGTRRCVLRRLHHFSTSHTSKFEACLEGLVFLQGRKDQLAAPDYEKPIKILFWVSQICPSKGETRGHAQKWRLWQFWNQMSCNQPQSWKLPS